MDAPPVPSVVPVSDEEELFDEQALPKMVNTATNE
jgi:hypothetical protein